MSDSVALTPDLLLRHEGFVLRLARSLVRDDASARDVAQETLLAAWQQAPAPGALRSWLARVVRRRASDLRRGERRRGEREERAARPGSQPPATTAAERLELEHLVVRAVLELEEPYRSVVVAVYYEGLTPTQVAQRRRVSPGTVRSQLSRALEQLRGRLDREHGGRDAWGLALMGLLRSREAQAGVVASGAAGATLLGWPLAAGGVLVAGATLGLGGWLLSRRPAPTLPVVAAASASDAPALVDAGRPLRAVVSPPDATEAASPAEATPEPDTAPSPLDALPRLLERTRQIKSVILERRLEVDPALRQRYAWLEALPDAGVVRLLDRSASGFDVDLPWMDGGGSYFSFTEGVHDYQRRPQIGLERMELRAGFYGRYEGAAVDLGEGAFRGIALDPGAIPVGLDQPRMAAWDLLHAPVEDYATTDGRWLPTGLRSLGFDDDADVEPGHTYLVRAVSPDEFDVLVVVEVAEAGEDDCTLAWRVLEDRPVPEPRKVQRPETTRDALAPPPPELRARPEESLRFELDSLRAEGERLLLETFPPDLTARFAGLLAREDAGLARLVERQSPWTELPGSRGGGAFYSFATRSHDSGDEPDLGLELGSLGAGLAGADTGVVLDLGELGLEEALRLPGEGAVFDLTLGTEVDHARPREEVEADLRALQARVMDLGARGAEAVEGHSYLVRSIVQGRHDLLVALEVAQVDAYGVLIAWQLVRSWPVPGGR